MRYHVLATDYDGTIAHHGDVDEDTIAGLRRLTASGRKLVLVTGRELEDLLRVFDRMELFELVVAENGALLYRPADQSITPLGERPPDEFARALRDRGVDPLSVGHIIVATWEPNETTVLQTIRDLGLELEIIFNKGAVMVLPPGVNKASGLAAALRQIGISPHNSVGVGDAENDHAFLSICECAVAVDNALPSLKERCDEVTRSARGAGVVELIDQILEDDLAGLHLSRHDVLLGTRDGSDEVRVSPQGTNVLVAGPSSSGKSTLVTGLLERVVGHGYQVLVIDPEGDYESFPNAVHLGAHDRAPTVTEVLDALEDPAANVVANLLGTRLEDRPGFLRELLFGLQELRSRTGRPHRIAIDETHHLLPADSATTGPGPVPHIDGTLMIAPHIGSISPDTLKTVDVVLALGDEPEKTMQDFSTAVGVEPPEVEPTQLDQEQALGWWRQDGRPPFVFRYAPGTAERRRHVRKYAEGDIGEEASFWFRGPEGALNLRAQNLHLFMQLGEGVDDATWLHHLRQGDYARWFREAIKDDGLAAEAEDIQRRFADDPAESRTRLRQAIERRYTARA
jgi:HAD superfamily hydrolase (TIGR01484 family)